MDILIKNGLIISDTENGIVEQRASIIVRNGRIEEVVRHEPTADINVGSIIDATGKIIIPGLVNAHIHSYASSIRGATDTIPLEPWMLYVSAVGKLFDPEDVYWSTLLGAAEMLKTGTTTCLDHLAQSYEGLEASMTAFEECGMRVAMAPMISDKPYFETLPLDPGRIPDQFVQGPVSTATELISTTSKLFEAWNGKHGRMQVFFGPSGPQRCSDDLLRQCGSLAREYDTCLHSHVLETRIQAQMGQTMYGKPMVLHLDELGLLDSRTSFAHGVWLSHEESRRVAERDVTIVHNPASNLRLGSGKAPLGSFRKLRVRVALGTDGANCCGSLNMFDSMKLAAILHNPDISDPAHWIKPEDVLRMATVNGAVALGMDGVVGTIEKGRMADLVILNPRKSIALRPPKDPLRQLVYGETGSAVETVFVGGKRIIDAGRITTFDEDRAYDEMQTRVERVMNRYRDIKEDLDRQAAFVSSSLWGEGK